jgi:hypothetical protein
VRNKLPIILAIFLLPLALGWKAASAAEQQNLGPFKIALADGSLVNGAISVTISLDTPYGQIRIPSDSLVSAKFDAQKTTAEIRLNDAEMKLKYNPATSDVKATTSAGVMTIALANVTEVTKKSAQLASGSSAQAPASQSPAQTQASAPASTAEAQGTPPVAEQPATVTVPPTVVYTNPEPYTYAPPYYYYSPYYYEPYYYAVPGPYIGGPIVGFSIGVGPGPHGGPPGGFRGGPPGGFRGGFGGGFRGGFGGGRR